MYSTDGRGATALDRRTLLGGLAGAGAALAAGGAGTATGQEAFRLGYHTADETLLTRTLVVYGQPEPVDGSVCELTEPVRHRIVGTAGPTDSVVYADLYVEERYGAGTVLTAVDRVQGCERDGVQHVGVLVEPIDRPPGASDDSPAGEL